MKKEEQSLPKFASLTEALMAMGLPKPKHPLITIINGERACAPQTSGSHVLQFFKISYKPELTGRKVASNDLLQRMETILDNYFNQDISLNKGLPTVHYMAEQVNVSPSYLSDMLRSLTGQNAQQHIHNKLIEKAKEKLSTTNLTVSEVAFELGFEHSQSFSKLFKTKTSVSPLEFRRSFQ